MPSKLEINRPVRAVENFLLKHIPVSFEIYGHEYIDEALKLLSDGKKLFIVADHRSTADILTVLASTQQSQETQEEGWKELIGERTTTLFKESYYELFGVPLSGFKTIGVASPSMKLSKMETNRINKEALVTARNIPGGEAVGLLLEARRIRSEGMQQARREATTYWKDNPTVPEEDIWFLPTAVENTEQQWPNGPMGLPYYFLYGKRCITAKFIVGKPFRLSDIKSTLNSLNVPRVNRKQMEADLVFNQVARLHVYHPEGNPDYAEGYYSDLNYRLVTAGIQFPDEFKDISSQPIQANMPPLL